MSLRPLTVADVLDGAFAVLKRQPAKVIAITIWFVVPVNVLFAWLQRDQLENANIFAAFSTTDSSSSSSNIEAGFAGSQIIDSLLLVFVAAAMARLIAAWYAGSDCTAGEALAAAGKCWWALLISWLLIHVLEALALVGLVVGIVVPMTFFAVTAPALVLEGLGPIAAMRRSAALTRRRWWPVLGTLLLVAVVEITIANALTILPIQVALWLGGSFAWLLVAVVLTAQTLVTVPFVAAAATLVYLDLRVRHEGLDIDLALRSRS